MSDKMKDVLKSVWQFCMFMFWPRWQKVCILDYGEFGAK